MRGWGCGGRAGAVGGAHRRDAGRDLCLQGRGLLSLKTPSPWRYGVRWGGVGRGGGPLEAFLGLS